jgi:hypothetical protein
LQTLLTSPLPKTAIVPRLAKGLVAITPHSLNIPPTFPILKMKKVGLSGLTEAEKNNMREEDIQIAILKSCQMVYCGSKYFFGEPFLLQKDQLKRRVRRSSDFNENNLTLLVKMASSSNLVYDKSHPWTVYISIKVPCNKRSGLEDITAFGTGVFISRQHVLTSAHTFFHDSLSYSRCTGQYRDTIV